MNWKFSKSNNNPPAQSKLGISTRIDGNILGSETIIIAGQVKGEILINGNLELTENAQINGNIKADKLYIHGKIEGNIDAVDNILIQKTAIIQGNISANNTANIMPGAIVNGQCVIGNNKIMKKEH